MNKEIDEELEKTMKYLQDEVIPSLKRQIEEKDNIIKKLLNILKGEE